jgi:hypothetical protein
MTLQKNPGAVRRFARLMKFAAWLQALPNKLTPPPFRLMQISSAYWQSRALYVAARLDIATVLGDATLTADAIAERVDAQADATARLMRMLAAMGVFQETAPRCFCNNRLSGPLRADHPQTIRAMILMHNSETMSRPWFERLEQGVRNGRPPFELAHGAEFYAWMDQHPDFDALFAQAMDSVEALIGDSFATDFDWGRFDRIIDVGGSKGAKSLAILKRHPRPTALVVDRAGALAGTAHHWRDREAPQVLARLGFQVGDLFEPLPSATGDRDIYLLSAILHGFDDDTCVRILANLAEACAGTGARIALLEMVLPEQGADLPGASFDMQMFMATRGRERTLAEWRALTERSGLVLEEVVGLQSFASLLVLRASV